MKSPESRTRPSIEIDPLTIAKQSATRKLLARYDEIVAEAEKHRADATGLAMLDRAERLLDKIDQVKAARTAAEVEDVLIEKGHDFSSVAREQSSDLKRRRGLDIEFKPMKPEISDEQLAAIHEVFGTKNLQPIVLPTPNQLDVSYLNAMYPATETADDTAQNIINHHPDWWNRVADAAFQIKATETWGEVYVRSMKADLEKHTASCGGANPVILQESIQKPNYSRGPLHYGSADGQDATKDSLEPILKEVFGETATRFKHTHDELVNQLIPKVKEKIISNLKRKGLTVPHFDVILAPAVAFNLQTIHTHSENSRTDTSEWSSDVVLDKDGGDSGHRLVVGHADGGGAGRVGLDHRGVRLGHGGFRLAVVLEK